MDELFPDPVQFSAFPGIICRQGIKSNKEYYDLKEYHDLERGSVYLLNAAQLVVSHRHEPQGTVIDAVGEVDLTTASQLREALLEAVGHENKSPVIVDLSKVDFIDSAGLALLVEARKRLSPDGRRLSILLTAGRQPERVLKLGRFDTIMTLAHSLAELA